MRFSLLDATIDGSGRVVAGSRTTPQEVTEIWTFRRPRGGSARQWELSAIQQGAQQLPLAS
jgi:predicted lipid-binding transport protein (Tim44 family)